MIDSPTATPQGPGLRRLRRRDHPGPVHVLLVPGAPTGMIGLYNLKFTELAQNSQVGPEV